VGYWVLKLVLTPLLRFAYRVRTEGQDHIPKKGPAVVAANHNSFIDSIFIPLVLKRRVTFLAKAEYFDNPRTAWFFRAMGQIPIKRDGGSALERALASAREVLHAGGLLAIYPEGTRSPDGRLYKGHTGVARIALDCDAPVVPVALVGTREVQPIGSMRPRLFRKVEVRIGPALHWPPRPDSAREPAMLRLVTDEIVSAIAAQSGQQRSSSYARRPRSPASGTPSNRAPAPVAPAVG
jgi:1-acyl-sn-glycerol-3-phosphate acyltransferase